jgi:hypothetical protein
VKTWLLLLGVVPFLSGCSGFAGGTPKAPPKAPDKAFVATYLSQIGIPKGTPREQAELTNVQDALCTERFTSDGKRFVKSEITYSPKPGAQLSQAEIDQVLKASSAVIDYAAQDNVGNYVVNDPSTLSIEGACRFVGTEMQKGISCRHYALKMPYLYEPRYVDVWYSPELSCSVEIHTNDVHGYHQVRELIEYNGRKFASSLLNTQR